MLADAHQLFRNGLRSLLAAEQGINVGREVASAQDLLHALKPPADFAIIDTGLLDGLTESAVFELNQSLRAVPSIFVSNQDSPERLALAMRAGAKAYMLKGMQPGALLSGIRRVAAGMELAALGSTADLAALAQSGRRALDPKLLTTREQEIVRLLAEGRTVRETASELALSVKTVEAHKLNLMRKLNIHSRASLVEYAIEKGYIPAPQTA